MSGGKVVSITGLDLDKAKQDVVACVERLLEQARSGELDGIVYAVSHFDGGSSFQLAGAASHSLLGAVSRVQYRLTVGFEDD